MPKLYDSKGKTHKLAAEIGRGGEGTVFFCEGNDDLVAKIYHEPISDEKAKKLQLMAENKNDRLLKVAAWVVETLHDKPNGKVVGFLMPRIKAKEIHELYSLKSRRRHFPHATWHYLIHTAANLARAFYSLHKYKHVIGDVNHGNCVVLADGTVKLIDCDSYAISDGENRFACEVGVATHLAPELQTANLSKVKRKPEHDNFALAVVIFQLLFLGRHPFAGNYLGEKDKTLEDCIREFRFAYGKNSKKFNVKQPPGTLSLNEVSPRVMKLFERAFDEKSDNRPAPREWIEALVDMSENLVQCGINPGHRFYFDLAACPWCRIESQTGLMLFPFVFSEEQTDGETPFNIFTVEKLIENLGKGRNLPAKLEKPTVLAKPEPALEIVENATLNRNHQVLFVGGYFIGLILLTLLFGLVVGTILGIFLMIYLFTTLSNDNKELQKNLMSKLNGETRKWEKLEKEFSLLASPQMFAGDINIVRQKVDSYKKLQTESRKELKKIELEHKHRKFTDYLREFRVKDTEIEGISADIRNDLAGKRVWTAAEIDDERLEKDFGVNVATRKKLLKWRQGLERKYSYKDDSGTLEQKKKSFLEAKEKQRHKIESEIEKSLESLRQRSMEVEKSQKLLVPKSEKVAKEILQSKSNLGAVGDTSIALASLILITVLVPFFGGIVSEMSSSRNKIGTAYDDAGYSADGMQESYGDSSGGSFDNRGFNVNNPYPFKYENLSKEEADSLNFPDEDITDEVLAELDLKFRYDLSNNLVRQAIHYVKNQEEISKDKDFDPLEFAEERMELAIRTKPDNLNAFEEFGKTLYLDKHYAQSLKFFETLDENNGSETIDLYIGMNFLELKNYKKARDKFLLIAENNPTSLAYYKLGLAYKNLKSYTKSKKSFEYAIDMDEQYIDAHYELGVINFKLKDKESFNRQYAKLLDLSSEKAKELLENSYKLPPTDNELRNAGHSMQSTPAVKGDYVEGGSGYGTGSGSGSN